MSDLQDTIRDLVLANRILAHEGVVDAYGHVSVRSPHDPGRYFISVSRSPELVKESDIVECTLDGTPVRAENRPLYIERHIHGAIYENRPEVQAVVHSHALEVLPFSISTTPLEPVLHSAGVIGRRIHVWDIRDRFGDTSLLVENMAQGRDLAERLAGDRVVLMRGHGFAAGGRSIAEVVRIAAILPRNAQALMDAMRLGGGVKGLSPGEIEIRMRARSDAPEYYRAWEYWAHRAGRSDLLPKPAAAPRRAPAKKKAARKRR
ncbi:MAG TPA: class II aldolase/adducin family protein [Stellaceae bacterium]|nr:class II aldolase/adducin family protein [Stellaceae bacterium]